MNKKKLLALLMALVMTLTLVPVTAFATDDNILPENAAFGDNTVAWTVGTNGEIHYATTLSNGLKEAYMANTNGEQITIYCKPDANVGTLTHGHVEDSLVIYGNGAYVSGSDGEQDLEVDQYEFLRTTGNQVKTGASFTKDVTITVYRLDGIALWGTRQSTYTLDAYFYDCQYMHRVYIVGTTGNTNLYLENCSFEKSTNHTASEATVYSNAPGTIRVDNCSFTGIECPINLNNKSAGKQTVSISNCSFTNCGSDSTKNDKNLYCAPIRACVTNNNENASTDLTVTNCTFTGTIGSNGDVLLGEGRTGKSNHQTVSLIMTGTAGTVQMQNLGAEVSADNHTLAAVTANQTVTTNEQRNALVVSEAVSTNVAEIVGGEQYPTLQAAIAALPSVDARNGAALPEATTIKLLKDTNGGFDFGNTSGTKAVNAILDLNGQTLTLGPAIGSSGTETNGIRVLAYSNLVVKNGDVICSELKNTQDKFLKVAFANYGTLELENVEVTGSQYIIWAVNNGGLLTLKGNTTLPTGANAIDGDNPTLTRGAIMNSPYEYHYTDRDASVNVADNTVKVGNIVMNMDGNTSGNVGGKAVLNISAGTYGEIIVEGEGQKYVGNITGGTFNRKPDDKYIATGYEAVALSGEQAGWYQVVPASSVVAKIGDAKYATLAAAVAEAQNNDVITLLADCPAATVSDGKNITFALNGHKLSGNQWVIGNATLTIDGTVENSEFYGCICVGYATNDNGNVVLNGGYYHCGNNNTVLHINGTCLNSNVTIRNATIESLNDNGIQLNGKGTFVISGSTITGATGVYVKSGDLTITGSKITGNMSPANYSYYGNGAYATGDAIVIDSCNYPGGAPTVMIGAGNTFTGTKNQVGYYEALGSGKVLTSGHVYANEAYSLSTNVVKGWVTNGDAIYAAYSKTIGEVQAVAKIGTTEYPTLAAAVAEAQNNDVITLLANVTLSGAMEVALGSKSVTLDLGGKTLTGRTNLRSGELTIKNGIVAGGNQQALNVYGSATTAENYSVLNLESTVTVTANVFAVCMFGNAGSTKGYGAVINTAANITTTGNGTEGAIFVSGNLGQNIPGDAKNVINVTGGSITSGNDCAIALNGLATVNVTGGALTGNTAITVKRGTLNVTGGTIEATGARNYPGTPNNNGTEMTGAAISISATYNQYGPLAVTISGDADISSQNADAVYMREGTYSNGADVTITGGKFSSDPSDYVAAGYEAVANQLTSGKWQVGKVQATKPTKTETDSSTGTETYKANKSVVDTQNENTVLSSAATVTVKVTPTKSEDENKAAASLNNIKDMSDFVATVTSKTGGASEVDVTVQLAKGAADTSQTGKIGYEVHPEAIISVDDEQVGKVKLENDQITGSFTFKLDVSSIVAGTGNVKVTHVHDDGTKEDLGIKEVVNGYITLVGIKSFSEFWSEPVTVDTTTGNTYFDYVGASLRRRVNTSAPNVVLNTSTDIRFQYTLKDYESNKAKGVTYFFQWSKDNSSWKTVPVKQVSAVDSNGDCTASLVINGVPKTAFDSPIYTRIYAVDSNGVNHMLTPGTGRANTVKAVAEIIAGPNSTQEKQWIDYAKYLLRGRGVNSYTVSYVDNKPVYNDPAN